MKAKKKFRVLKDLTSDLNIEQAVAHTKLIASPALKPSVVNRNTSIATNSIVNIPVPFTKLELKLDFNSQNFPHKQPINFNSNSVSDSSKLLKNSMKKSVKASKVAKKTYQKCTHDKFAPIAKSAHHTDSAFMNTRKAIAKNAVLVVVLTETKKAIAKSAHHTDSAFMNTRKAIAKNAVLVVVLTETKKAIAKNACLWKNLKLKDLFAKFVLPSLREMAFASNVHFHLFPHQTFLLRV